MGQDSIAILLLLHMACRAAKTTSSKDMVECCISELHRVLAPKITGSGMLLLNQLRTCHCAMQCCYVRCSALGVTQIGGAQGHWQAQGYSICGV